MYSMWYVLFHPNIIIIFTALKIFFGAEYVVFLVVSTEKYF